MHCASDPSHRTFSQAVCLVQIQVLLAVTARGDQPIEKRVKAIRSLLTVQRLVALVCGNNLNNVVGQHTLSYGTESGRSQSLASLVCSAVALSLH